MLLGPVDGKPVVVDDASYVLGFESGLDAAVCYALLTSLEATDLLDSLIFWDSKRPINKKILQRIDLIAIAETMKSDDLFVAASAAARLLDLEPPPMWEPIVQRLVGAWRSPKPKRTRRGRAFSKDQIGLAI